MCNNREKSTQKVIIFVFLFMFFVSCKQSCFHVITNNNVAYWSRYSNGIIMEYSKKDSILKYLNEDGTYCKQSSLEAIYGIKFRITNDTLFRYVNHNGFIIMYDTIPIVSYSKKTIVIRNNESEKVLWHRLSTKMMKNKIKLQKK